ncbi:MAG: signal recognition particle-docking protein FtsY [Abditibacteriota bacterium]|nr:signal recognition particle-docking protein FtsY [Abditibacteriota bacterium]
MKFLKNILGKVGDLLTGHRPIDEEFFNELEESMLQADLSVRTVESVIEELRSEARRRRLEHSDQLKELIIEQISGILSRSDDVPLKMPSQKPTVYMLVGVNGVGKTTSIAKLARFLKDKGNKVVIAAADTFRAAAVEQLGIWADRVGVDMVRHQQGSDPGAVVYDSIESARAKNADAVIIDTAGRLHNKSGLMEELGKIGRIVEKSLGRPCDEVLLVLDATTGQNAISQAREFSAAVPVSGIILTKMDGTAKGGVAVTVREELNIPVKLLTSGESATEIEPFNSLDYARSLFD